MKSITSDIISALQSTTFTPDVPNANILDSYPLEVPNYSSPYIIVNEIDNSVHAETFTNKEEHSDLSYEIEIYCKQMTISNVATPSKAVAKTIGYKVNDTLATQLGLRRSFPPVFAPYDTDPTVSRYIMTFDGILDLTTDYIYGR